MFNQLNQKIMKKSVFILTMIFGLMIAQTTTAQNTIVDAAVGNEDFSTLVAALTAADLVGALQGDGPFTVFAPTNSAFAKIDKDIKNVEEKSTKRNRSKES